MSWRVTGHEVLADSLRAFAPNRALWLEGVTYSYRDLDGASRLIALELTGEKVAILGGRSFQTFAAIVALMRSGRTYIPLNSEQPDDVLRQQLALAEPDALIFDQAGMPRAKALLGPMEHPPKLLYLDPDRDLLNNEVALTSKDVDRSSNAPLYEMFTSGTTGQPKRIAIPRNNVAAYLASIKRLFDFGPDDRFSQFFKLTFDLSVHDIVVTWTSGGCLFVPSDMALLDPVRFAKKHDLSVWFSVPSLARLAMMTRKLSPNALPGLRHALFCGEALPQQVATTFAKAAPNATVTNLYGPTEATIAITSHRFDKEASIDEAGSVPIGHPFSGQEAAVVDADMKLLPEGEVGELLLGGSQLAEGYADAPALSAASFQKARLFGFKSEQWYRTGDLVRQKGGTLIFMGRVDTQIKFRGHRIELGVIEAALADEAKSPLAAVIATYKSSDDTTIEKLIALVATPKEPIGMIRMKLSKRLPAYMVPAEVIVIPSDGAWWNQNGKVDRRKLQQWYAARETETADD